MRAFLLPVDRFADVVQKTGPACNGGVKAQFGSHHTGKVGDFEGVVQHVLTVAGAVTQPAQQLDKLVMNAVNAGGKHGALTFGFDGGINLTAGFFNGFLDSRRMDASVRNESFEGDSGDLTPHGLEARERDGLGCVIDNQVDSGQLFDCPDVAAFTSDNSALHFVVGQRHNADRGLRNVVGGAALNREGNDLARNLIGFFFCLLFVFHHLDGFLVDEIVLKEL